MDLIDRNALMHRLKIGKDCGECEHRHSDYLKSCKEPLAFIGACIAISQAESVPQEVFRVEKMEMTEERHGEWVEQVAETDDNVTFDVFKCSQCGHLFSWPYTMKYCCNCGAKMDCIQGRDGRIDLWEKVGDSE